MALVTGWRKDGASISEISVNVGETVVVTASLGREFDYFSDTMSTANTNVATASWSGRPEDFSASVSITGVSPGTTETAFVYGYDTQASPLTITVLFTDDEEYLNKRGLTHFWENIDDIKQDKLTAGTGIAISNNVISVRSDMCFYGTCSTAAGTAAKVVACSDFTAADLVAGTRLTVHFTNANSFNGQATLNVNSTGAKNIYYNGTATNARYMWVAGESVDFVYNGTQWAMVDGGLATTTYYGVTKLYTGATSTSTSLSLTPASLNNLVLDMIAPYAAYSASSTYAVGDRVRYGYYVYECITAITTAEAWTAAHWRALPTIYDQIGDVEEILQTLNNGSGV